MNNTIIGLALTLMMAVSCTGESSHQKEALRTDVRTEAVEVELEPQLEPIVTPTPAPKLRTAEEEVCQLATLIGLQAKKAAARDGIDIAVELISCKIPPPPHDNVAYLIFESKAKSEGKVIEYMWVMAYFVKTPEGWELGGMQPVIAIDYTELEEGVLEVQK